jgi:hypothetical protein
MGELTPAVVWDAGQLSVHRRLGNFVQYFQVNLPVNHDGVPMKLIDPTVLMEKMIDYETTDDVPDPVLELATQEVDLDEGIPTLAGVPIWERLDGEAIHYYKLFQEYREMLYLTGSRAIAKLARNRNIEGKVLSVLSKVYHWQLRVKAFDLYKKMEAARKKQFEIENMIESHTKASKKLLEYGLAYIEDHPEQLSPKVAIQMVEVAMKSGRLSLGLSDKPGNGNGSAAANIQINNTTHTGTPGDGGADTTSNGSQGQQEVDPSYTQSILHILDASGALDEAKSKIIDVEFSEVDESENALEGTNTPPV